MATLRSLTAHSSCPPPSSASRSNGSRHNYLSSPSSAVNMGSHESWKQVKGATQRPFGKMGFGEITVVLVLLLSVLWLLAACSRCSAGGLPASVLEVEDEVAASLEWGPELFEGWMEKHRKVYAHPEEKARRYANFLRNLEFVSRRNAETARAAGATTGYAVGLNVFADLSNQEFKEMYSSRALKKKAADERGTRKRLAETAEGRVETCDDVPASLDWRKKGSVTGVKDQGQCGSCWAFSSTGAMEGINAIVTGQLISLSEQELVDCDTTNDGCDGGYMDYAFEWAINNGGIDSESNYPYTGQDGVCNTTKEEIGVVSIDGYKDVTPSDSALLCAAVQQPISVGIDGSSLDFQLYTGGIYDGDCSSNPDDIDHAVLIAGYGREGSSEYWIVKNSWGTDWGMQGYIYIKRNTDLPYGVCAINAMASYPTKQSSASAAPPTPSQLPSPPPPPPSFPPPVFPPPIFPPPPPPPPSFPPPVFPPPIFPPPVFPPPLISPPPPPIFPPPLISPPPPPIFPPPTSPPPPPPPIFPPPVISPPPPPIFPPPTSPPPPPPSSSPPPPTPSPWQCSDLSYCPPHETCCCLLEFGDSCFIYGCCGYENAVCCADSMYCCPQDYAICDLEEGLCLKNRGDIVGVEAKKRKLAKHKFPWTEVGGGPQHYRPLLWKRGGVSELR